MRLPFPMKSYTLSLARSRYLLFKPAEKWTDSQKQRAGIAFKEYPDIERAYSLSHSLRMIFNKRSVKAGARMNLAKWYREVEESGFDSFNTIAATLYDRSEDILNFYVNKASNAAAESFNAKIKLFRAKLRGVADFICFYISYLSVMGYTNINRIRIVFSLSSYANFEICHNFYCKLFVNHLCYSCKKSLYE